LRPPEKKGNPSGRTSLLVKALLVYYKVRGLDY